MVSLTKCVHSNIRVKTLNHETKSNSQDVIVQETQKKTMELEITEVY